MDEITYRRKLGFALTAFFIVDLLAVIFYTLLPIIINTSDMSVEIGTLLNVSVGIILNLMASILLGYMLTRPGLCPNKIARISCAVMLLIVVFNLVVKLNVLTGGPYWFANMYWYDTVVSLLSFLAMSGFLFNQRIWLVNKLLGSGVYFLNIILVLLFLCYVYNYFDFTLYNSFILSFDVIFVVIYVLSIVLLMIWTFRKPR